MTPYDAQIITMDRGYAAYFEKAAAKSAVPKLVANWFITDLLRLLNENSVDIADCKIAPEQLAALVDLIQAGTINGKTAKTVFEDMFQTGGNPGDIVKAKGLVQVSDESAVAAFVDQVIANNPTQVEQYKSGKANVLQFFIGQTMKLSKGKANPQLVQKLVKERLG